MFEFMKEENQQKMESERLAKRMLAKFMTEVILGSEKATEGQKLDIRILNQAQAVEDALSEQIVDKYVIPGKRVSTELKKKVLEYLELVEIGIKQFSETTPFEEHTEEE